MIVRAHLFAAAVAVACFGSVTAASAQSSVPTIAIPQAPVAVLVGNGVQQSAPILSLPSQGETLIGVGALSGGPTHYGSLLSLSLLNTNRLVGIDGPGGPASSLTIGLSNPRQAPILSK